MLFISEILTYFFILPTSHFDHMLQGQFLQYRANIFLKDNSVSVVLLQFKFRKSVELWLKKYQQLVFKNPYFKEWSGTNGLI